ncbi:MULTISPECIES: DUF1488 domain-containing protein [Mesorhizobium]|jgi:hypothetical protein|uniref:DUF1488 domain-containing protein n=5 Tax=Mesorhizobium TaxID=68287 RepID=A0A271LBR8_9HYPH|nr:MULTISPECIES: DUF1488 domain-containing protein [Mesorhizobium]PAQ04708.1 DUF1488 domain-containing protein [Mesorhizobium temperatum]UVC14184.1 DUF1488 domain-containing protein [Mesorhizobium onobrychidis]CAH2396183.1 conserved hypothetical protein [Mesorhizobium ventifaucium]SIT58889.1 conserved hypothetical protein [Mesorhizobium prunaredense]SJM32124.1 conserved hypothetical protein [Mesorhizobium delmotii]
MSLTFPNRSRSYDEAGKRIRFVGHDGMFQISFSVATDAISKAPSEAPTAEATYLAAFDTASSSIHEIARNAYARTRKSIYVLTAADFR